MWMLLACRSDDGVDTTSTSTDTGFRHVGDDGDSPGDDDDDDATTGTPTADTGPSGVTVDPPLGGSSGGAGGATVPTDLDVGGETLAVLPPGGLGGDLPLLLVFSGTEGRDVMAANMGAVRGLAGLSGAVIGVLDGRTADSADGAAALDRLRADYDVDNDRTWLLSESAGTVAGLELGLDDRQSYFAACWANDVVARRSPTLTAAGLGFAPWGNAGPGGDQPDADAIVAGMASAGYRLEPDSPYSGPGAGTHGSPDQFLAAVGFFADKSRD